MAEGIHTVSAVKVQSSAEHEKGGFFEQAILGTALHLHLHCFGIDSQN